MSAINYKRKTYFILIVAGICSSVPFIFSLLMMLEDPLQIVKKGSFDSSRMTSEMRLQAAGIINNHKFDSIILGTSMLQNSSASEASEKLGGTFVNLSASGFLFQERSIILAYALNKGLSNVVYSLDNYFSLKPRSRQLQWVSLYDATRRNDLPVYLTFTEDLFELSPHDMDRPTAWNSEPFHYKRFGGMTNWVENIEIAGKEYILSTLPQQALLSNKKSVERQRNYELEALGTKIIEDHLLKYVKEYPDTTFYFIFPPYFKPTYAIMRQNKPEDFFLHQYAIRVMVEASAKYPNMFVYGFENEAFTFEIARYKDNHHYDDEINSLFFDSIVAGENLLTLQNVDHYLQECEQQAFTYNLHKLNDDFQHAFTLWEQKN